MLSKIHSILQFLEKIVRLPLNYLFSLAVIVGSGPVFAQDAAVNVPMQVRSTGTLYVPVSFGDADTIELLLDTGSRYSVINETTLKSLQSKALVQPVYKVDGILADGRSVQVPIYRIPYLSIGCCCAIEDIEVAVFAANTREILGLNALAKVSPFEVSIEPAELILSHCRSGHEVQQAQILDR